MNLMDWIEVLALFPFLWHLFLKLMKIDKDALLEWTGLACACGTC